MDEVCDLEFSARREWEHPEDLKYLRIKLVIADIGEIADARIGWFFDDSSRFSFAITDEYPKELRTIDSLAEGSVSWLLYEPDYISTSVEIIARYDDELASDMSLECEDRSTCT